jgi:ABC-type nitrate/sulfonate/bicarbonate transport system substrate-binding protein
MTKHRSPGLLVLLVVALTACGGGDSPTSSVATPAASGQAAATSAPGTAAAPRTTTKVVFQAGFKAQANLPFVAAYVAKEKGFFAEEGLDVEIQHSSGNDNHMTLLAAGRIQFSTTPASTILKQRSTSGAPFAAIALFGQRGDTVFAVLADSGINGPKDFAGKTVGYKSFPSPEYLGMLKAAGVDRTKISEVGVGFDPRILIERKVDVLPVFRSNEPNVIRGLGVEVKTFDPADYGVATLGVTYVVNSEWAEKNAATTTSFLRATMRAVAWLMEHRDEAIDITLRFAPMEQRAHQRFMLDTEIEAAQSDLTRRYGIGWMEERQWQAMQDALVEFKGIEKPTDVKQAFTTKYLAPVYKDGKLTTGP